MPTPGQKLYGCFNGTIQTVEFVQETHRGWSLLESDGTTYFDATPGSYYESPFEARAKFVAKLESEVIDLRARQAALQTGIVQIERQIALAMNAAEAA